KTNLNEYQNLRFSVPSLTSKQKNEISYKIISTNLRDISKLKTLILSQELSSSLVTINCGNGICNPGEDFITCPEDCRCGNNKCDLDESETSCPEDCKKFPIAILISLVVLLGAIASFIFVIYKTPSLRDKLNLDELLSKFKHKKQLFTNEEDLQKLISFIKASKAQEHTEKQISLSLTKKGWTKTQVNFALKKSKVD
ncbi:MAG: hypothetical protein KKG75_05135, partial [Nanoarchaeota archaeon]|nr:hypothetical protein [Nanoarchaeota archaeon]